MRQFASRIRWLAEQVFGRSSAAALRTLLRAGRESRPYSPRPLSAELRAAIRWLLGSIPKASPRLWSLETKRKLHLFTDGAFEGGKASIGAVLCDSRCAPLAWFGGLVPDSVTSDWFSDGTEHPIIQAELAAVLAAFHVWKQVLLGTNVLLWIDNEVVRFGIINAHMHPPSAMALLSPLLALEESTKVSLWVCRVPSHSNPSDGPSRGTCPAFLTQARPEKVDVGEVLLSACGQFSFLSGGTDTLDHSLSELLRLPEPVPLPRVAEGPAQAACASAQSAGAAQSFAPPKAKGGGAWSTAEEKRQRLQALCKWSNLLRLAPKLFSERTLASLPDTGDQAVAEHLDLLFSRKSTNTLLLRVQPLMRFVLWARRACPDESPSEQLVWVHCRWLQTTAAPSSIDIFVSSLHFVHGTLGLGVPVADLLSPRIRGLAHTHLRTKEPVNQAPPLSTAQVKWLEYLSGSAPDDYERLVAATLCFMVFARARRSDLARATHVQFDLTSDGSDGFVECKVKNPKPASRRNLFLPLTAVYRGLGSASWGALFFAARARLGLQNEGALDHPLIPALSSTGRWLPDCLSSAALTTWLRALLSRAPDADYGLIQQLRSHSCKATALSWCSKMGLDDRTVTLLGYHSQGRNMASLGYRRDVLAGPLRDLSRVIQSVASGSFCPDVTRSGRWQVTVTALSQCLLLVNLLPLLKHLTADEQQVAAAPHFLENLLSFGNYAVAKNKSPEDPYKYVADQFASASVSKAPTPTLEEMRQTARDALLQGAKSGKLLEVLRESTPKASSPKADGAEVEASVEELRQLARDALLRGAQSGKLFDVLAESSAKKEQANKKEDADLDRLRLQARDLLLEGAQSGKLWEVLQGTPLQESAESSDDVDKLRQQAREALLEGAKSGKLFEVLSAKSDQTEQSASQPANKPSAEDDMDDLRRQAREALLLGAQSGKLMELLAKNSEQKAASKRGSGTGSTNPDELELLRQQAREALIQGAQSGRLLEVLAKPDEADEMFQLKKKLCEAIAGSMETGELTEALREARDLRTQEIGDALRDGAESGKILEILAEKAAGTGGEDAKPLETTQKPEEVTQKLLETSEAPKATPEVERATAVDLALQLKLLQDQKRTMAAEKECLEDLLKELELKNSVLRSRSRSSSKEEAA
ncbi:hypothetical protein AK812_SmicGene28078 [Symbiodinium microadriaticum]|uniref:Uncharacterized protein n=1 Tax=Symbiodinium microadriaticum TaxID=2951 RepID=A0A1Q9D580_SYMMI|nr:hypothetical protein AK812_SmicGene28078 [Symbiodinium microadriaticum]